MIDLMKDVPLFGMSTTTAALTNILCSEHKVDTITAQDLLSIARVGSERMSMFVQEYTLPLPTGGQ